MDTSEISTRRIGRRELISLFGGIGAAFALGFVNSADGQNTRRMEMKITCFVRYQIDPFQREEFKKYAGPGGGSFPGAAGTWWDISCRMRGRMILAGD